ncbi:unnamed protein product [Sphenostylis stenocarpa]|uniref:Disease resistance RPP13-like protein 1 n=1 Tax=Sphenostylis stenocarpa TaxID=92480 RepID=A0AA86W3P6_9FABA|nr:unnamed protein product [Sphenostylis stenocarpa]
MPVIETLGGALFGAVLQVLFDRVDSRQILDYFLGRKLDEKLLRKLRWKLVSINAVVDDAEQKQFRNAYVRAWVHEVRDVLLDTEDLLDEIHYEFSRCELEAESHQSNSNKVCKFESRIWEVLDDLESLKNQKDGLGLRNSSGVGTGLGSKVSHKLESTSLVVENVIYGRDDEKEKILKWMNSDTDKQSQLSIFSVVGMGGLGKTTLAQHVYNDSGIEEGNFAIRAWVCVSDEFDVLTVTKQMIGAITKSKDDGGDLEMVQGRLKEKLIGRKFLVVLDDVWNEDREKWKALQTPLNYGAKGSKIIVTTRSNKVAWIVQSNEVHELTQLGGDHSWQVFAKHAFQDDNPQMNAELKEIGTKIVEKCKGLPLALETVGSLLRSKSSVSEWKSVLRSEIWEFPEEDSKIIPALLLSYYHLPSHLKRCFSYCAVFPKDHEFVKENLIHLWMAENFLQCSQQSKSQEEVGQQYFNDLLSRSFFRQSSSLKSCFVMHDLLNDLAKYVSGDICFRLGVDREESITKATRHLSCVIDGDQYYRWYECLYNLKRLRTFFPVHIEPYMALYWNGETSMHELIFKLKFLRILSFNACRTLEEVPDTIGDLIHLRYLDLSWTYIKKLPDSTCSLCNLQTLKLNGCCHLKELPSDLHKLTNLRRLELIENSVTKVPMHMGELKNLQILMTPFNVGKSSELRIQQLGELSLHGDLLIENLQNTVNPSDALAGDLKNKTNLIRLDLRWDSIRNLDNSIEEREVLENLQPSRYLKHLSISEYGGTQFPSWLSDNSLSNVVSLSLNNCRHCLWLPSLGLLTFLKHLKVEGLDWIARIDADFYGNSSSSFASLKSLKFSDMKEWEEWQCMTGAFPNLRSLSLENCPKLKGHLPDQLCHLKYLLIKDCKELVTLAPSTPEIFELELRCCGKLQIDHHHLTTLQRLVIEGDNMEASLLERLGHIISHTPLESVSIYSSPNMNLPQNHCYDFILKLNIKGGCDSLTNFDLDLFPKLCHLILRGCRNLQKISQGHPHNHMKNLTIKMCSQFESFPSEGLSAPQLESIDITKLENLKSLPENMPELLPSLTDMCLIDCPGVEFSDGCLPSNLKSMDLSNCSKLVASLKGALGDNPYLESLFISEVDVECFPGEGLLPLSLTTLEISGCPNLKKLDYNGLSKLSSLEELFLHKCPILQCLPEEGLPKSISTLHITDCPLLKQRCKKQGEDWEKIAHIKDIVVDGERVKI